MAAGRARNAGEVERTVAVTGVLADCPTPMLGMQPHQLIGERADIVPHRGDQFRPPHLHRGQRDREGGPGAEAEVIAEIEVTEVAAAHVATVMREDRRKKKITTDMTDNDENYRRHLPRLNLHHLPSPTSLLFAPYSISFD